VRNERSVGISDSPRESQGRRIGHAAGQNPAYGSEIQFDDDSRDKAHQNKREQREESPGQYPGDAAAGDQDVQESAAGLQSDARQE